MSNQTTPKAKAAVAIGATASRSPDTMATHSRPYARYDSEVGDLFANARNRDHSQAPASSASRTVTGRQEGSLQLPHVAASNDPAGVSLTFTWEATIRERTLAPVKTKYVERGGHRGPYDYPNQEHSIGSQQTNTGTSSFFGFPSAHTSSATPKANIVPLGAKGGRVAMSAVQPPEDAQEHQILLGPLRLAYHHCIVAKPENDNCGTHPASAHGLYLQFFDERIGGDLQTVIERDAFIPNVVYVVGIKMTDLAFQTYHKIIASIPEAARMQKLLSAEAGGFDELNASPERSESEQDAYQFMVECNLKGQELDETMEELVGHFNPIWKENGGYVP